MESHKTFLELENVTYNRVRPIQKMKTKLQNPFQVDILTANICIICYITYNKDVIM